QGRSTAWVSSQKDLRRAEPETIDIQLRVARRSGRLRRRIGCCRAISLPSLPNYANFGIVSQCGLASDTGLEIAATCDRLPSAPARKIPIIFSNVADAARARRHNEGWPLLEHRFLPRSRRASLIWAPR